MKLVYVIIVVTVVAALAGAVAMSAPAAQAGQGGTSIATAPTVSLNRFVTSGWVNSDKGEYWRVLLHTGDRLTLDYGAITSSCPHVDVHVYAPNVTDYTVASTDYVVGGVASPNDELVWVAPVTGSWILYFTDCSTNAYRFRATVRLFHVPVVVSGSTIAHARQLPIGRLVTTGWVNNDKGQYWRVSLHTGNRLILDYGAISNYCPHVDVHIYAPNVTDYTVANTDYIVGDVASPNHELVWAAPRAGRWIVYFTDCSTNVFKFKARVRQR
jgi:hypothetical protein